MYKNQLQQFALKSGYPLPIYTTISEGPPHLLRFKTSVVVGGVRFEPPEKFNAKKESEQHAAKVAFEELSTKCDQDPLVLINSDITFCKSIIQEFTIKMNLPKPEYKSFQAEGLLPVFYSSLELSGRSYQGIIARNKNESQQLAARAAIQSILASGDSLAKTTMSKIVRSKSKLYAAIGQSQRVDPCVYVTQPRPFIGQHVEQPNLESQNTPGGPIKQSQTADDLSGRLKEKVNWEPQNTPVGPICQLETTVGLNGQWKEKVDEPQNAPVVLIAECQTIIDLSAQREEKVHRKPQNTPVGPICQLETVVDLTGQRKEKVNELQNASFVPIAESQTIVDSKGQLEERVHSEPQNTPVVPIAESQTIVDSNGQLEEEVNVEPQNIPVGPICQPETAFHLDDQQEKVNEPQNAPVVSIAESQTAYDSNSQLEEEVNVEPQNTPVGPICQPETAFHLDEQQEKVNEPQNAPVVSIAESKTAYDSNSQLEEKVNGEPQNTPVGPICQPETAFHLDDQQEKVNDPQNAPVMLVAESQTILDLNGLREEDVNEGTVKEEDEPETQESEVNTLTSMEEHVNVGLPSTSVGPSGQNQTTIDSDGQQEMVNGGVVKTEEAEAQESKVNALTSDEKQESVNLPGRTKNSGPIRVRPETRQMTANAKKLKTGRV